MNTLPALPSLDALLLDAQNAATQAAQGDGGDGGGLFSQTLDKFDQAWVKLAQLEGHSVNTPTAAASSPATTPAASSPAASSAAGSQANATSSGSTGGGVLSGFGQLMAWAGDLVTRQKEPAGGVTLEDMVLIVLGLVLLAAAVVGLIFTFDQTKKVAGAISTKARGIVDAKAAAKLAELAA